MEKIYIAGPMSGIEEFNYPLFNRMAEILRAKGHEVENPAENPVPECGSWEGYMRLAIVQVAKVDTMVMLPNWEKSKGAILEHGLAVDLRIEILLASEFMDECHA